MLSQHTVVIAVCYIADFVQDCLLVLLCISFTSIVYRFCFASIFCTIMCMVCLIHATHYHPQLGQ